MNKGEPDNRTARDIASDDKVVRASEWREDGLWVLVLTMGRRNFCTYIGIPVDHPLAGYDYDELPVDCHGGLTFAGEGDGEYRPEGYYWYGWDYAHSGDFTFYKEGDEVKHYDKDWTLDEVKNDAWHAIYEMGKLKKLAESIYSKAKSN